MRVEFPGVGINSAASSTLASWGSVDSIKAREILVAVMSRAPKNEVGAIPMHAALSPYGVIDFAENSISSMQMAPPGGVVGGPPAYLEAHGIRYVPSGVAEPDCVPDPMDASLVPMRAQDLGMESSYVSPEELNSRVDDRIKQFMQTSPSLVRMDNGNGARGSAMRSPYCTRSPPSESPYSNLRTSYDAPRARQAPPRISSGAYDEDAADSSRLRALRRECELADGGSGAGRLRALRAECDAAAAVHSRGVASAGRSAYDF